MIPEGFQSFLTVEVFGSRAVSLPLFNIMIIKALSARASFDKVSIAI